jgi:hypothetical protein
MADAVYSRINDGPVLDAWISLTQAPAHKAVSRPQCLAVVLYVCIFARNRTIANESQLAKKPRPVP